jgi:predicted glycosyltransferase
VPAKNQTKLKVFKAKSSFNNLCNHTTGIGHIRWQDECVRFLRHTFKRFDVLFGD